MGMVYFCVLKSSLVFTVQNYKFRSEFINLLCFIIPLHFQKWESPLLKSIYMTFFFFFFYFQTILSFSFPPFITVIKPENVQVIKSLPKIVSAIHLPIKSKLMFQVSTLLQCNSRYAQGHLFSGKLLQEN